MFVCPNTRLTLSMGMPFESAKVANECRPQWKEMAFSMPQAVITKSQGQVFDSPQGRGKALAHF